MSRLAGIIHPNAFKVSELVSAMNNVFCCKNPFHYFRHKNLELGAWGTAYSSPEKHKVWAAIDGSIYNSAELKEELKKLGYHFREGSDAELIAYAYSEWQEEFVKRLNGPFALALFDERQETLILARDRIGQKSLFWTAKGDYWLFASEAKGLVATGIVPQTPSLDGLAAFLYFGFIPQDFSAIQGVNKLLPGHLMKINLAKKVVIEQYWSLSSQFEQKQDIPPDAAYNLLGERFEKAFRSSLSQNAKVGASLAGTLGSSAIAWFLAHLIPRDQLEMFSAFFHETEMEKNAYAKETASLFSLHHQIREIQPLEALASLPAIIWHLDDPIADPHAMQVWSLSKIAAESCSQFYTDLGWVEMFAGSRRFFHQNNYKCQPPLAFLLAKLQPSIRDWIVLPFFQLVNLKYKYSILRNMNIDREQVTYLMNSALFQAKSFKHASPLLYKAFHPELFTQRFHKLTALSGSINFALYYDAKTLLPDCLLAQYDKLFSAQNVKLTHPYLDNGMVEFLAKIPDSLKFKSQESGALLRHLMERLSGGFPFPPEGNSDFVEKWMRNPQFRWLFEKLQKGRLVEEGLISAKWLKKELGYPYMIPTTFRQLWAVLIMEIWFRLFINRPLDISLSRLSVEELLEL